MTSTTDRLARLPHALAAAAALAGVLAGLPYALLHYAQQLRPQHLPTINEAESWAQDPLSALLLLQLLYCACWLLWAYLLLQVLRELCWYAANFAALIGGSGSAVVAAAARRTIAGLLVGAIVLAIATSLRGASAPHGAVTLAAWSNPVAATAPVTPNTSVVSPQAVADASTWASDSCTVQPGDTLWDLADRHLDNPLRWREIFELNKLRAQPDGAHLSDPDKITPGWTLLLPGVGPQPATSPAPPHPAAPPAPQSAEPPATPAPSAPSDLPRSAPAVPAAPSQVAQADEVGSYRHEAHRPGIQLPRSAGYLAFAVGLALSAAAVRRTLRRRRDYTPGYPVGHQEQQHAEETPLVAALRGIARHHQVTDPSTTPVDFPVATRGSRQQGLLDLLAGHQHSVLALTGPGADDAARAMLATALTAPGRARLLLSRTEAERLVPSLTDGQLSACRLVTDPDDALAALEEELLRRTRLRRDDPQSAEAQPELLVLLTSHEPRRYQRLRPLLEAGRALGLAAVVLAGATSPPPDATVCRIDENGSATINGARDEDPLRFFHLPVSSAENLLGLIPEVDTTLPDEPTSPEILPPVHGTPDPQFFDKAAPLFKSGDSSGKSETRIFAQEIEREQDEDGADGEVAADGPPGPRVSRVAPVHNDQRGSEHPGDTAIDEQGTTVSTLQPPINISLLGPLAVTVKGQLVTRGLTGFAGELLAYLATHPAGSTKDAILEAIWPEKDPVTTGTEAFHTAKKSIRGALRTALGATTSLSVLLQAGGLWRLDPALADSDLDHFQAAVRRAASANDPTERAIAHRRTIELYNGELCEGMDRPWLTAPREDARRRILNALGTLATNARDPEEALGLLECALEHDPYNEQLHLRLARQHIALGRSDAVRRTQERLRARLAEIDEPPTPATTRAFEELVAPSSARAIPSRPLPQRPSRPGPVRQARPGPGAEAKR